ncbi:unnamed protein product [Ectocarpus fasciculatus]
MAMLPEMSKLREAAWPILQTTENVFILEGSLGCRSSSKGQDDGYRRSPLSWIRAQSTFERLCFPRTIFWWWSISTTRPCETHPNVSFGSYLYFSSPAFNTGRAMKMSWRPRGRWRSRSQRNT